MTSKIMLYIATVALVVTSAVGRTGLPLEPMKMGVPMVAEVILNAKPESPIQVSGSVQAGSLITGNGTTGPPIRGSLQVGNGLVSASGGVGSPTSGSVDVANQVGAKGGLGSATSGCILRKNNPKIDSCMTLAPGLIEGHTDVDKTRVAQTIVRTPTGPNTVGTQIQVNVLTPAPA